MFLSTDKAVPYIGFNDIGMTIAKLENGSFRRYKIESKDDVGEIYGLIVKDNKIHLVYEESPVFQKSNIFIKEVVINSSIKTLKIASGFMPSFSLDNNDFVNAAFSNWYGKGNDPEIFYVRQSE